MIHKKDFKPLISRLKKIRSKAKRCTKSLYHKNNNGEYDIESRVIEERNDEVIRVCDAVINELETILKK